MPVGHLGPQEDRRPPNGRINAKTDSPAKKILTLQFKPEIIVIILGQWMQLKGSECDLSTRNPHRIDADRRRISRTQAAHWPAASVGYFKVSVVAPRRSSMTISGAGLADAGSCSGTNVDAGIDATAFVGRSWEHGSSDDSASRTQRRSRFALIPRDMAMAAIDTPGCRHAVTASALNSSLCRRRRRRASVSG